MRLAPYFLLVMLIIPILAASADGHRTCVGNPVTIEQDIAVSPQGPTFIFTVRYPNGVTRAYEGDEIPSHITVPVGSYVELKFTLRSGKSGKYNTRACVEEPTDLPEDPSERMKIIHGGVSAGGSSRTGDFGAIVQLWIEGYWPNLRVKLEVDYSYIGQGYGTTLGKTVIVSLEETASSTTSSSSTPLATATIIGAGSSSSTSNRATTTGGSTNTRGSSGGTSGAASGQSGGKGVLTINPSSMRVDAGEIAVFDLCTSLSSPTFKVEDLPTGYRYVITPSGDCYKLKVFTHPLSYGRFKMTVVAKSGRAEERGNLSLLVKRAETPSPTTSSPVGQSPTLTPTLEGSAGGGGGVAASTLSHATETQAPVTVVTVIKKEEPPIELLAGSGVALLLTALLALLLIRRR